MIRKIAMVLLALVAGYVLWVVLLNLPGGGSSTPEAPRIAAATMPTPTPTPSSSAVPKGPLIIPVAGVGADALTDTFDDARGEGRVHDAIDIMAPRGTPVVAAATGTVEKLFDSRLGGRTIYIRRTGGEWVDYYAHLDAYAPGLTEGKAVVQGEMIGTVGSTGDASPEAPHLHYAINAMAPGERWHQGEAVNPYPLLKAGR